MNLVLKTYKHKRAFFVLNKFILAVSIISIYFIKVFEINIDLPVVLVLILFLLNVISFFFLLFVNLLPRKVSFSLSKDLILDTNFININSINLEIETILKINFEIKEYKNRIIGVYLPKDGSNNHITVYTKKRKYESNFFLNSASDFQKINEIVAIYKQNNIKIIQNKD